MHKHCSYKDDDDIIVYMDDDDYYPPERVSHSVKKLIENPKALAGGASELYLWFNTLNKMYKFGPYGPNHATAGTFAFRRKLLKQTSYEDNAALAEEKHFLQNYTVPFVQFDPMKTILVVSHEQNTFDKRRLINKENKYCKESVLEVKHFIKNEKLNYFYDKEINEMLKNYEAGDVKYKPNVLAEIKRRDEERRRDSDNRPSGIIVTNPNVLNEQRELTILEVKQFMEHKTKENQFLKNKMNELTHEKKKLQCIIDKLKEQFKIEDIIIEDIGLANSEVNENDVNVIVEQTDCSKEVATRALQSTKGDVVDAILQISENASRFETPLLENKVIGPSGINDNEPSGNTA